MFESAELGHAMDREAFDQVAPRLRRELLDAELSVVEQATFPVVVVIAGVDGAGKGETVNLLNEWMDPRHIQTHAMDAETDEERERPPMWRYWRRLPPKGKLGVFFGSWYTAPIVSRAQGTASKQELDARIDEIVHFERMLADEGALIVKLWFHLSKKAQRKRLRSLESDERTAFRVTKADWKRAAQYDEFRKISEYTLRETSTADAPWIVVEGTCPRYRAVTVAKVLRDAMKRHLQRGAVPTPVRAPPMPTERDSKNMLSALDLSLTIDRNEYEEKLAKLQTRLGVMARAPSFQKMGAVLVFEGSDAAGKGGSIRRITRSLDARQYQVVPIAAPTEEERAQPYLWRFWRHMPRKGRFTIFDRSWYGRVLVERVEGFCTEADWMRAYAEINDFEEQLVRHGIVVIKLWLSISPEEQLRRFQEREQTDFKQYKITKEDWRNREKSQQYENAACDMFDRTSTDIAPWTLVEANDKQFARVKILRTVCERLERALG